ncbi:oxygenase MpaB family protein [uncultured Cellulomonas sp.]|uniref:oxygenase MpaB family protein n=1 Tax=uncultured Cellulomonas sp. TaxID=189682 RepID=UPI002613C0D8|nr:oxygenase MpaB family protein [uncultured Cellulomonas sp.]
MPGLSDFFPPAPSPGHPGDPGLFGPGSAAWRIGRERLLLAAGPAALLLQVAHPLVAAGVAAHSDFTADPLRRLQGTLDAVLTVTFGDTAQVRQAARHVARRHRPVQGTLPVTTGPIAAGTRYRATDADLALWVFVTLLWTSVTVTDRFARPVGRLERDAYLRDLSRAGRLFGVPAGTVPGDWAALEQYVRDQVRQVLTVGPAASRLAADVLRPDPPLVAPPLRRLPALLAADLLPAAVREAYGLPWRRRDRAAVQVVRSATRHAVPLLPPAVRYWPHHLVAVDRLRAGEPAPPAPAPAPARAAGEEPVGRSAGGTPAGTTSAP